MKILLISHKHPPSLGGMETQSFHIAQGLKRNHDVTEIIYKGEGGRFDFFLNIKSRIKKALDQETFDIIHLNDGLMAFLTSWLPNYTSCKIVITFHGLDLIFPNSFYQNKLKNFQQNHCHAICVSKSTYDRAIKRGFSTNNLRWIDNGVDHDIASNSNNKSLQDFSKEFDLNLTPDKDIILISIGRAVPRKGFSWFIDQVMPNLPSNYKYLIVGPNNVTGITRFLLRIMPNKLSRFVATLMGFTTDYDRANEAITRNNLGDRVFFLNKLPFPDLINVLQKSQLMVMPNVDFDGDMEGFGLVILEANVCEKYVLATNIEGITSAIHDGENGSLLPLRNVNEWVNQIMLKTDDLVSLNKDGIRAKEFVFEQFSWSKMVSQYEQYFEEITAN